MNAYDTPATAEQTEQDKPTQPCTLREFREIADKIARECRKLERLNAQDCDADVVQRDGDLDGAGSHEIAKTIIRNAEKFAFWWDVPVPTLLALAELVNDDDSVLAGKYLGTYHAKRKVIERRADADPAVQPEVLRACESLLKSARRELDDAKLVRVILDARLLNQWVRLAGNGIKQVVFRQQEVSWAIERARLKRAFVTLLDLKRTRKFTLTLECCPYPVLVCRWGDKGQLRLRLTETVSEETKIVCNLDAAPILPVPVPVETWIAPAQVQIANTNASQGRPVGRIDMARYLATNARMAGEKAETKMSENKFDMAADLDKYGWTASATRGKGSTGVRIVLYERDNPKNKLGSADAPSAVQAYAIARAAAIVAKPF